MKSSLNKSYEQEPYYQKLVKDHFFETHRDIYEIAILIGFISGEKKTIDKIGGEGIKEHLFDNDMRMLDIVAVLAKDDVNILLNENKEEKYKLFEEYANCGMQELINGVFTGEHTNADNIIDFVMRYAPESKPEKFDFQELFKQMADDIRNEVE